MSAFQIPAVFPQDLVSWRKGQQMKGRPRVALFCRINTLPSSPSVAGPRRGPAIWQSGPGPSLGAGLSRSCILCCHHLCLLCYQEAENLVATVVPTHLAAAVPEVAVYLKESVGNSTRIDYGTGTCHSPRLRPFRGLFPLCFRVISGDP